MKYTVYNNEIIDKKIDKDLVLIVERVKEILGVRIHSILLVGGFGRGEGSVVFNYENIHIVNDYDILIVVRESNFLKYGWLYKRLKPVLEEIAKELGNELNIKQVDLDLVPISYFTRKNQLRIQNYEVLEGHYLLYGNENLCEKMSNYKAEDIPLFEGTWLFRNRGVGLLIAAKYFIGRDNIPDEKKENFVIECNKAIIAMGDSLLLLKKKYHYLYQKRKEIIQELDFSDISLAKIVIPEYIEAIDHKLKPDFDKFYKKDLIKWWYDIANLYDEFYRFFEMKRLGAHFSDWLEYNNLQKPEDAWDMKSIKVIASGFLRKRMRILRSSEIRRFLLKAKRSGFTWLMALLLFSLKDKTFNERYLYKACELLGTKMGPNLTMTWKDLTDIFLQNYHPTGEAGRVIGM